MSVAAEGAGEDADQGHADLHGGQETLRIVRQHAGGARAGDALGLQHREPGAAGGDEGQFAQGEGAVQQDEEEDYAELKSGRHGGSVAVWGAYGKMRCGMSQQR
jgi:hypothetical protein